ncbi:class I SAM-dependent methyltransferase [Hymenobacter sp. RP-2-7]|uniref:Class I SAM-dependent methyltransferase n=1 Tax=Hymenobacter polaris TaxID=2682546 RepID=A0A7Y0FMK2_9BACT|nr:class I SAM-dependent methyltransferase [Hymenobacter polaris]NML65504.1 class I SAM-dependent methyltransferase [Hymenobacter polaris]
MNKATLSTWLRRTRLLHLADNLRFWVLRTRYRRENQAFRAARPTVALPPDYLMYESFKLRYRNYYEGGRETAEWVKSQLAPYTSLQGQHVLDWGCGPGRVVRHLPEVIGQGCQFTGTDVNAQSVAWCRAHLPGITFLHNGISPPLALADNTVDAAYGISIFTHLSAAGHARWLAELLRVLRPGGVLLLTTHGAAFQPILLPAEQARFAAGELVERRQVREGHRVFAAFQPPAFLRQLFGERLLVLHHEPGRWLGEGASQDVWVLRKA